MALLAACAIVVGLSACSSSNTVAGCSPTVSAGDASKVVSATGKLGTAPVAKIPTPLYAPKTQVSTIIAGHGAAISSGQPVVLDFTSYNGRTDKVFQKTAYLSNQGAVLSAGGSELPAVNEALVCAQVGSRIAIVASPKDGHAGKAISASGIRKNDSLVYIVDVRQAFLAKANGRAQAPQLGRPAVVTSANGTPGITLPPTAAPKSLQTTVLKAGTGAKLKTGGVAIVKYTAVGWSAAPSVFDSTWKAGEAAVMQLGSASLSAGLTTALTGKTVGSQVLVVIPASQATPADGSGSVPPGEAVVYVVDILGIPG
jgi:FKBP-type peptidyl-prolyl cis-trans isomerase